MKIRLFLITLAFVSGCSSKRSPEENTIHKIEELGGFVIQDEDDNVTYVNLSSSDVDSSLLKQLSALKHLEYLILENTKITNDDLKYIGQISALEVLNINMTLTTDEGLFHLLPIDHLIKLKMDHYSHTRPLPEELKNFNTKDFIDGKIELPKIKRDYDREYGDGIRSLMKKFPNLQATLWGAINWPGLSKEDKK